MITLSIERAEVKLSDPIALWSVKAWSIYKEKGGVYQNLQIFFLNLLESKYRNKIKTNFLIIVTL